MKRPYAWNLMFSCFALAAAMLFAPQFSQAASKDPAPVRVTIKDDSFHPATLTIPAGTAVTFTNTDDDPHTVSAVSTLFDSHGLAQDDTFRYVFRKPGRYEYYCKLHPFMRGVIIVTGARS